MSTPFSNQTKAFETARLLVAVFYLSHLAPLIKLFVEPRDYSLVSGGSLLWPVRWITRFDIATSTNVVETVFVLSVLLAAIFPASRAARALAFVGSFFHVALANSFDKINHGTHTMLYISFVLIFLPRIPKASVSRVARAKYLVVFSAAQASLLLTYTLAGWWKLGVTLYHFAQGQLSAFSLQGFSYLIARKLLEKREHPAAGLFLIDHPQLGRALLVSVMFLQFFSIFVVFRPKLHRFWGFSLILFHMGTALILTIPFANNVFLLALFLCLSPFSRYGLALRSTEAVRRLYRSRKKHLARLSPPSGILVGENA